MISEPETEIAVSEGRRGTKGSLVATLKARRDWARSARIAIVTAVSVLIALGLAAILIAVTGGPAAAAFRAMIQGSVGSVPSLVTSMNYATPILLVAVGTSIAGRAGLLNVGQEGQLTIGGLLGTAVALHLGAPGLLTIPLVLLCAATGGALWAGIAAVLRYWRNVHEVIATLLLNFLAIEAVSYAVNQDWLLQETQKTPGQARSPRSDPIATALHLPSLISGRGYRLTLGVALALTAALTVSYLVAHSRWGFSIRALGLNPRAARRAHVSPARVGGLALVLSGAFAGLAGGALLTGSVYRIQDGFSNNYGWEGLLVALVVSFNAASAIPVAFLFGALRAGGAVLASVGVSPSLVVVIQALVVIAVTAPPAYMRARAPKAKTGAALIAQEGATS